MSKSSKVATTYNVANVEFSSLKNALAASANLSHELANKFNRDNCSPFAFCKWLAKESGNSAAWFKSSVLALDVDGAKKPETILSAIRAIYPIVNNAGNLCKKVVISKGFFRLEEIALFSSAIIENCVAAYLRGTKQEVLPAFGEVSDKGEVSEITEAKAAEIAGKAKAAKEAKKAEAAKKVADFATLVALLRGFVSATAKSKDATIVGLRSEVANLGIE